MIICICNRINCSAVRDAVDAGARSPKAVHAHHGRKINCGKCSATIGEMIAERVENSRRPGDLVAAE